MQKLFSTSKIDSLECTICNSKRIFEHKAKSAKYKNSVFSVMRCRDCGFGWTYPVVSDRDIGRWYPESYYGKKNIRFNQLFEMLVLWFRKRRARVIAQLTSPGPVLDVGCGRGLILGQLQSLGYEAHGVEISEKAAWYAQNKLGIKMHINSDFLRIPLSSNYFYAVIFWHSLEHFRKPLEALVKARTLLKNGGLLIVAVPNSDSLQSRIFLSSWFHLDVPRHYVHFGQRSLEQLLIQNGFKITSVNHFSLEQNIFGWLQSFYDSLGLEFNFLYSLMKSETARITSARKHPFQLILIIILLPLLTPLSFVLAVGEALLKRGGTIEVYATKNDHDLLIPGKKI